MTNGLAYERAITGVYGFRKELRDSPVESGGNPQLAHFMTAVAIGKFNEDTRITARQHGGLGLAIGSGVAEDKLIRILIGHEKIGKDQEGLSALEQAKLTSDVDVSKFVAALNALGDGVQQDIDLVEASKHLSGISIGTGKGASKEDLVASLVGYKFGQLVAQDRFKTPHDAAQWLRRNVSQYRGGAPIDETAKRMRNTG